MQTIIRGIMPHLLPARWRAAASPEYRRQLLARLRRPAWLGTLRRTTPLSDHWGFERGTPIDRYYIGQFLNQHRSDIQGRVLEVKDSAYTDRYGLGVTQRDVLDIDPANRQATFVADLGAADAIPSDLFDCFVLTQTLQFIYPVNDAVAHIYRILKPGGVLLATLPGLSRVEGAYASSDYWRFTPAACTAMFGSIFGTERVSVTPYGNVLSAISYLAGMACEELTNRELRDVDPHFPVIIAVRAIKRGMG